MHDHGNDAPDHNVGSTTSNQLIQMFTIFDPPCMAALAVSLSLGSHWSGGLGQVSPPVKTEVNAMIVLGSVGSVLGGVLGLVLWAVILVWIYTIAQRKGRHPVGWLVLGFFFSLITLVVILLLPSKRTTEVARPSP
jgi:ABC-type branched-subunit amino acid transport system permease subunit